MEISCQSCSSVFNARKGAKFCSARCRNRGHRVGGAGAPVVALPAPAAKPRPLVVAVEGQLRKAERLDTPAGQMALVLAERLAAGLDTGSALATLSRELTARMAEALAGATVEPDALDELAARRLRKASGD